MIKVNNKSELLTDSKRIYELETIYFRRECIVKETKFNISMQSQMANLMEKFIEIFFVQY